MANTTEQGKKLLGVQLACLAIVWLIIFPLRVWSRVLNKRRSSQPWSKMPWPEDATMFLGLLLYTLMAGFALNGIFDGGIGKHSSSNIPLDEAYIAFRAWFVCELIYGPLSAVIRTSIALLLLRLLRLPPSSRSITVQKWILYVCMSVVYIFTIIYFFINLLQCSPPSYFWEQFRNFDMSGKCDTPHLLPNAAIAHSAIAAASDLTISVLSAYMIAKNFMSSPKDRSLKQKPRLGRIKRAIGKIRRNQKKIVVIIFLSLGSTAGAVMLARINFITVLEIEPDFLYQTVDIGVWSIIEPCVGIVAGSLPYIRTLFQRSKSKDNSKSVTLTSSASLDTGVGVKDEYTVDNSKSVTLASSASLDTGVRVKDDYTVEFRSRTPGEEPGRTIMCNDKWLN